MTEKVSSGETLWVWRYSRWIRRGLALRMELSVGRRVKVPVESWSNLLQFSQNGFLKKSLKSRR